MWLIAAHLLQDKQSHINMIKMFNDLNSFGAFEMAKNTEHKKKLSKQVYLKGQRVRYDDNLLKTF